MRRRQPADPHPERLAKWFAIEQSTGIRPPNYRGVRRQNSELRASHSWPLPPTARTLPRHSIEKHMQLLAIATTALLAPQDSGTLDEDWRGFRGTDGTATSEAPAIRRWSDEENVVWKTRLPGPGTSSPIVVGDRVFVSCWSGYGLDLKRPGNPEELRRHFLCVDAGTGEVLWSKQFEPAPAEDPFGGRMANHGYASSTPVSDGEKVFAFFGKSGVMAFDFQGELLWHVDVGNGSSKWLTGSGSSPVLGAGALFINASDESESIIALDTETGEELWRRTSNVLDQAYGAPVVTLGPDPVVTIAYLGGIWGLDPKTGEFRWTVKTRTNGALAPTILPGPDMLYSWGGQTRVKSHAVRLGGKGDVTQSHIAWSSRYGAYVPSPLLFEEHLYWVDEGGVAHCARADNGELVYRERLEGEFYSSVVRAGDAIYAVSRENGTYVFTASPVFELLEHNVIDSDASRFDGSPAVSGGDLFLRSRSVLYRIGN